MVRHGRSNSFTDRLQQWNVSSIWGTGSLPHSVSAGQTPAELSPGRCIVRARPRHTATGKKGFQNGFDQGGDLHVLRQHIAQRRSNCTELYLTLDGRTPVVRHLARWTCHHNDVHAERCCCGVSRLRDLGHEVGQKRQRAVHLRCSELRRLRDAPCSQTRSQNTTRAGPKSSPRPRPRPQDRAQRPAKTMPEPAGLWHRIRWIHRARTHGAVQPLSRHWPQMWSLKRGRVQTGPMSEGPRGVSQGVAYPGARCRQRSASRSLP